MDDQMFSSTVTSFDERRDIAAKVLIGLVQTCRTYSDEDTKCVVGMAIKYADELIKQLDEKDESR